MVNHDLLSRAYRIKDVADSNAVYREWAESYDADLANELGYAAPAVAIPGFARHVPQTDAPIADLACGTGLAGVALREHGYSTIDGYDLSEDMLAQAAAKGIYRSTQVADLSEPLAIEPGAYAAAVAIGVFSHGFLLPDYLEGMLRIVKPGGVFTFTVNEQVYAERRYPDTLSRLADGGVARVIELWHTPYIEKEGIGCWIAILRVAGG